MSLEAAFIVCRLFHYGAAMVLFGASVFVWMLAPAPLALRFERVTWLLVKTTTMVLVLSGVCWLFLEAASMGEGWGDAVDPAVIGGVLFGTTFGHAWLLHLLLVFALLGGIVMRRSTLIAGIAPLVLASLGLIGHAAMQAGVEGWLHRANLAVHLLSGGFWFGALLPLLPAMRLLAEPEPLRGDAILALRRFSTAGHFAVALVIATGVVNMLLIFGTWPTHWSSPYQSLLAIKIGLVCAMTALAFINRYGVVPSLARNPAASVRAIRLATMGEIGLGAAVLGAVSLFGLLDPMPA